MANPNPSTATNQIGDRFSSPWIRFMPSSVANAISGKVLAALEPVAQQRAVRFPQKQHALTLDRARRRRRVQNHQQVP